MQGTNYLNGYGIGSRYEGQLYGSVGEACYSAN